MSLRLSDTQWEALGLLYRAPGTANSLGVYVSTLMALERKNLIHVETSFNSITYPMTARATITDAGIAAWKAYRKAKP